MTLVSGCKTELTRAICDATVKSRDSLTVALLVDGGPKSKDAGAELIGQIDAGCSARVKPDL